MGSGYSEQVRCALISTCPDHSSSKCKETEQRIWQMNQTKEQGDQQRSPKTLSHTDLDSAIDKPLESVLLEQRPERQQQEPRS